MSDRRSKKAERNTPIRAHVAHIDTGDIGDRFATVTRRRYIEVDIEGLTEPLELNAWEAVELGHALVRAGRKA